MAKVERGESCWEWTAQRDRYGYGKFFLDGATRGAHRVAYELFVGPVPTSLQVDHLCRNHGCVNPDHLEAVTQIENMARGVGAQATALRTGYCVRGHEYTVENTLRKANGMRICKACNRERCRAYHARRTAA